MFKISGIWGTDIIYRVYHGNDHLWAHKTIHNKSKTELKYIIPVLIRSQEIKLYNEYYDHVSLTIFEQLQVGRLNII